LTSAVAAAPLAVAYVLCVVVPSVVSRASRDRLARPRHPRRRRRRVDVVSRSRVRRVVERVFARTSSVARALATRANRRSIVVVVVAPV